LAEGERTVFQNSLHINQMLVDTNQVDFRNVKEQASKVCHCDDGMEQQLKPDL
jgi:hypothetical protein